MNYIEVEKDGILYAAEYFVSGNQVSVVGNGTVEDIFMNGMKEINAARTGLRNLIWKGKAFTKEEVL